MRISMRTGDRGYCHVALWNVIIRFNGELQRFVIVADDDAGYIVRAVQNEDGRVLLNPITERCYEETLYGKVSIQRYPTEIDAEAMSRACRRT